MANNSQLTEFIDYGFYDAAFQLYAYGQSIENRMNVIAEVVFSVDSFDPAYTGALYEVIAAHFADVISNLNSLIREHETVLTDYQAG